MEIETLNKENCKYLTKSEIVEICDQKLNENMEDYNEILLDNEVNNIEELLEKNKNGEYDEA